MGLLIMRKDRVIKTHNNPSFDKIVDGMKIPESFEQANYIVQRLKAGKPTVETRGRKPTTVEIDGETRTIQEWSELSFLKYGDRGATPKIIYDRMRLGKVGYSLILPVDEAIRQGKVMTNYQKNLDRLRKA